MSLASIDWSIVASAISVIAFIYGCFRSLKSDIKEQLKEVRDDLGDFRDDTDDFRHEVHSDFSEVKERISFLEATTLYTMPIEPVEVNPRSKAAREVWQRRKQKRLENKG